MFSVGVCLCSVMCLFLYCDVVQCIVFMFVTECITLLIAQYNMYSMSYM